LLVNSKACAGILKFVCRACEDMAAGAEPIAEAINPWRGRLASNPLVVREGFIEPNDEPGLGLTIDEDMLADYPGIAGSSYVPPR
jgi:L-alanine-DL-glutamate epimerase-like enolase superfamily enzyme